MAATPRPPRTDDGAESLHDLSKAAEGRPMILLRRLRRAVLPAIALPALALSLGACHSPSFFKAAGYSNPNVTAKIRHAYEERDACLAKNAAPTARESDVATAAQAVTLSCMPLTNQLIAVTNPYQDPQVTEAIMKDNEAKALRYVTLARDGAN